MDRYLSRAADEAMDTVQSLIAEIEKLEEIIEDLTTLNTTLESVCEDKTLDNIELRDQIIVLEKDLAELAKTVQSLI